MLCVGLPSQIPSTICWSFWLFYHKSIKSRGVWLVLQGAAFFLIYLVVCSQNPDSRFRLSLPPHLAKSVRAPRGGEKFLFSFFLAGAGAAGTCICVDPYLIMYRKETWSKLNDHRAFSDIGACASMCPFFFTNLFLLLELTTCVSNPPRLGDPRCFSLISPTFFHRWGDTPAMCLNWRESKAAAGVRSPANQICQAFLHSLSFLSACNVSFVLSFFSFFPSSWLDDAKFLVNHSFLCHQPASCCSFTIATRSLFVNEQ